MTIPPEILTHLREFDWVQIITKGNQLDDLNDRQWRFIKGLVAELIVEKHSGPEGLQYVGEDHKDYVWPKHNVTVELKSQLSGGMYGKKGGLNKTFSIKLNNSLGTNKHEHVPPEQVADLLLVLRNDGAFVLDKQTVIAKSKQGGDGFEVIVGSHDIVEITGKISISSTTNLNLKEKIQNAIREVI